MVNITWSYEDLRANGTSLKNYGYGISMVGGLSGIPPKEGKNYNVAYGRGTRFRAKTYAEVQRTFVMWIDSRDPETGLYSPEHRVRVAQRNANAQELFRLFATSEAPVDLERDVIVKNGASWTTETWTAQCEVTPGISVDWGDKSSEETIFSMGITFMDPFWYGDAVSADVSSGASVPVTNDGDVPAIDFNITLTGSLTNPQLTNTSNNTHFRLGATVAGGDNVLVETRYPRVTRASDSANLIGAITHSGSRSFMRLEPGSNTLSLSTDSGSGSASIIFQPPHV